jgi:hypothetical protein
MDLIQLNEWLSKTVLGMIVLGAIGSALFAVSFWLFKKIINYWFPNLFKYLMKFIRNLFDSIETKNRNLKNNGNTYEIIVHFTYHLLRVIFCVIGFATISLERKMIVPTDESTVSMIMNYGVSGVLIYIGLSSCMQILIAYWEQDSNS